jgi:hypothetical protein
MRAGLSRLDEAGERGVVDETTVGVTLHNADGSTVAGVPLLKALRDHVSSCGGVILDYVIIIQEITGLVKGFSMVFVKGS